MFSALQQLSRGNYLPANIYLRFFESLLICKPPVFYNGSHATIYFMFKTAAENRRKKQDLALFVNFGCLDKDFKKAQLSNWKKELNSSKYAAQTDILIWMLQILNAKNNANKSDIQLRCLRKREK